MPDCIKCQLFQTEQDVCLHTNRPGGLALTKMVADACDLKAGDRVLDAGCGTGKTLQYLSNDLHLSAIGMDSSEPMLRKSRSSLTETPVVQATFDQIPLVDSGLQSVLIECALGLADNTHQTLAEVLRILRPGGKLAITDLYIREISDPVSRKQLSHSSCLTGVKTRGEIEQDIRGVGFKITEWQDQTRVYKEWLAGLVFKLGSLASVYSILAGCENGACELGNVLGSKIKLGYFYLIAEKP